MKFTTATVATFAALAVASPTPITEPLVARGLNLAGCNNANNNLKLKVKGFKDFCHGGSSPTCPADILKVLKIKLNINLPIVGSILGNVVITPALCLGGIVDGLGDTLGSTTNAVQGIAAGVISAGTNLLPSLGVDPSGACTSCALGPLVNTLQDTVNLATNVIDTASDAVGTVAGLTQNYGNEVVGNAVDTLSAVASTVAPIVQCLVNTGASAVAPAVQLALAPLQAIQSAITLPSGQPAPGCGNLLSQVGGIINLVK